MRPMLDGKLPDPDTLHPIPGLPRVVQLRPLIAAQDDMLVPASCSERLAKGLPDATLMPMLGGHACNVTEPLIFDKILRGWLSPARLQGAA